MDNNFIFIVGMPRSGTTLMRSLISSHPDIAIAPETHFINYWVDKKIKHLSVYEFEEFWEEYTGNERFRYLGLDEKELKKQIFELETISYKSVFKTILREYASLKGKSRTGEKTPAHYSEVETIFNWYPDSQVIWMIRDPRAVCSSYMKVPWATQNILVPARRWRKSTRLMKKWEDDNRVSVIKYEDLVTETEKTLKYVFYAIDETYYTGISSSERKEFYNDRESDWESRHVKSANKPVHSESLEKWKVDLSKKEIKLIESINKIYLRELNYDILFPKNEFLIQSWKIILFIRLFWKLIIDKELFDVLGHKLKKL